MNARARDLGLLGAVALAYFVAGKVGLSFATLHSSASAVWPPTGIALAALILFGPRLWPAVFAGAFLVNWTTAGTILTSLGIAAGNTLEGLAGAWLVSRFAGGRRCFEDAGDIFKFAALAAMAATVVSATIGVAVLSLAGLAEWRSFGAIWLTWWLGDAAGALIVAPLILIWAAHPRPAFPPERAVEGVIMLAALTGVGLACFVAPVLRDYPLVFLCLAPLAWLAFRLGPREVASAIAILAVIAVWATESGLGPFVTASRNESFLILQAFMGMIALTMLPMAALVEENRRAVAASAEAHALERRARGEAQAATRARDEFLAMLSHELRNPLQAITTSVLVLQRQDDRNDAARQAVAVVARQTEHLARLLNDLLDVARVIAGKIVLARQPVDLAEVARHGIEVLAGAGRLARHRVEVDARSVWVDADPARMDQIVTNLVTNALKFTSDGGAIRVSTEREGGEAVLRVHDEGVGIAPELLPRVFDLFTQGQSSLDRREGGLGVGLTLVRRLAELHGGGVVAKSAGTGTGSEFTVRLPCLERPPAARGVAPATQPAVPSLRVLIVEDNADARESMRALLELEGHEVHETGDGEKAVDLALDVRPDLIFVDIGLPGLDGYEVARRLRRRQQAEGGTWRLVALTGYGLAQDRERAHAAGFDEHVVKPLRIEELYRVLRGEVPVPAG